MDIIDKLIYFVINNHINEVKKMSEKKKNGFFAEFKTFISRGSVLDLAVGVVVGSAFTAIVTSFVGDIINPLIGLLTGGVDFGKLAITLREATDVKHALTLNYGNFINAILNFLIIAFFIFLVVRASNKMKAAAEEKKKKEEEVKAAAPAPVDPEIELLKEIRDLLKK